MYFFMLLAGENKINDFNIVRPRLSKAVIGIYPFNYINIEKKG